MADRYDGDRDARDAPVDAEKDAKMSESRSRYDEDDRRERRRSRSRTPRSRSRSPYRRPRSRSRSRSPYRRSEYSDRDRDRYDDRDRGRYRDDRRSSWRERGEPYDPARKAAGREALAQAAARNSRKDCRVYVGNLSFSVRWGELKDFMREAGRVVFAEVLQLPDGSSKGCGLVEYETPEDAARAIRELNNRNLFGRQVFLREDREDEARYGSAAVMPGGRGRGPAPFAPSSRSTAPPRGENPHTFVSGLATTVGWQDLKDLFRGAGTIVRADVKFGRDGQPNGMGTVTYETPAEAEKAIEMYNGFEFHGGILEVREDRFPGSVGRGGFRNPYQGGAPPRGGYHERDSGRGYDSSRNGGDAAMHTSGFPTGPAGSNGTHDPLAVAPGPTAPPSRQIFVKNLPFSTANEDLLDLFGAIGAVEHAEINTEDGGRSKGTAIVQYATQEDATAAVEQLHGYVYGGRALTVDYNAHFKAFSNLNTAAEMSTAGDASMTAV